MPSQYWDHAFLTATFLINRLPTSVLGNVSPYFLLYKTHPDYKFLKVFGSACYPFLRPYNQSKLSLRSKECLFLGYASSHKGYKCLDAEGRIFVSKDVLFNEFRFPFPTMFPSSPGPVLHSHGISSIIPHTQSPSPVIHTPPQILPSPSASPGQVPSPLPVHFSPAPTTAPTPSVVVPTTSPAASVVPTAPL